MGLFRDAGKAYKPAPEVDLGAHSDEFYLHANVKAPRVAGLLVKIFVWILESPILGWIVLYMLKKDNLVQRLVSVAEIQEPPLFTATHSSEDISEQSVTPVKPNLSPAERVQEAASCLPPCLDSSSFSDSASQFKRPTIRDFFRAYKSGETTPLEVARRFLAAAKETEDPKLHMAFFISYSHEDILRQAEESSRRYRRGGTRWLHKVRPCIEDASCVKQLRSCGAILVGKTNMHKLGAGASGINPHYG